jgi:NADH:ubiquinone oxidoreductase subunit F (NADH-binding)
VEAPRAVLLGGYAGAWVDARSAWDLPLDPARLRRAGLSMGCGVVALLPASACGVQATSQIMSHMAAASAGQCGPCRLGLGAIAETARRMAAGGAEPGDLERLRRWCSQLPGRGACGHPDGAARLLASALTVFEEEFHLHQDRGGCSAADVGEWVA